MKTAFLIKSMPRSINFHCDDLRGIAFTTSYLDVTYLDNIVVNGHLKIFTVQKRHENGVGKPVIWFLIFTENALSNESFEQAWKYANAFGSELCKYTQLGQSFSYRDCWAFPGVPNEWDISQTMVQFNVNGGFDGIYWDDPTQPIYYENGKPLKHLTMKTINADIVTVIGSQNHLSQSHFTHFTIPGMNTNIDVSPFGQKSNVIDDITKYGFHIKSESLNNIIQLYNRAITQEDMFVSYTILFQMIESIIRWKTPTKINKRNLKKIRQFLNDDADLKHFEARIVNSIGVINIETSDELLKIGISEMLEKGVPENLDFSDFAKWRKLRGSLTHPKEAASISQNDFFETYQSLRKFCSELIAEINS
jgi:hypothetical protein